MIKSPFDLLMPHYCCSCGAIGDILCDNCKFDIENEPYSRCGLCAQLCGECGLCDRCQKLGLFDQFWCVGYRAGTLKRLIDTYKFDSSRSAGRALAEILDNRIPMIDPETVVVGVPTSSISIRSRGFDHMAVVVRQFAKVRKLPASKVLRREDQVIMHFLNKSERQDHAGGLFSVQGAVPEKVLLLDDIITTGTTLRSAAKMLKASGVKCLYGAVIARHDNDK